MCATLRKMCVRRSVLSSLPSRARHSLMSVREICEQILCGFALKKSVVITLSTTCDLAIGCLGVFAKENIGVRVATIYWEDDDEEATPRKFPILALSFQVRSKCYIEWYLPYSLVLRNIWILSSLFLSKTSESLRSGLIKILSRSHRSKLPISIIAYLHDGVFVVESLVSEMSSWNGPRIGRLRVSIHEFSESFDSFRVLLPPDHIGIVTLPFCSSSAIHCFPMVSLLLSCAMFPTSRVIHSCKVTKNYHSLESGFDPFYCFFIKSKTNAASAEDHSLWYVPQTRLAPFWICCPNSCNWILPSLWIVRLGSSLNLMEFSAFPKNHQ